MSRRRVLVANSEGIWAEDEQLRTRLMVQCVALGDTGPEDARKIDTARVREALRARRQPRAA